MFKGLTMDRLLTPWRAFIALIFLTTLGIVYFRFFHGLGTVTALNDATPWGIWIGFDILAGVGLAAGGFVTAGIVYIFQIRRFKPMVRMAILTAMLGYLLFIAGLIIEIGRPWNMLHTLTDPNIHSPLWEVAMCVMTYTTVLVLEFSLVVFERLGWTKLVHLHHKVGVVLVAIGIILSTLHQSTLGTLFTIVPHKMHPLWYSEVQPIHFFISCVAAGMAMVSFEAFLSYRFTKHAIRYDLLSILVRVMSGVLIVYFLFRIVDLGLHGALHHLTDGKPAMMFWLENLLLVFIPVALVFRHWKRLSGRILFFIAFITVMGFIMHRFNIAVSSFQFVLDTGYFPTWTEFAVSAALVTAGFVAAGLAIYLFPMHPHEPEPPKTDPEELYRVPWPAN